MWFWASCGQEVSLGDLRADDVPDPFDHLTAFLVELGGPVDAPRAWGSFGGGHASDVCGGTGVPRVGPVSGLAVAELGRSTQVELFGGGAVTLAPASR